VTFSLPLAGIVTRMLALIVDLACVGMAAGVVDQLVRGFSVVFSDGARAFQLIAYFVISTGYGIALEWFWHGQTLGKRILGLRVMDGEGRRLRPAQVILRNLMRPLDMLPGLYGVGGTVSLLSRYSQRLGDLAANTIVVRPIRAQLPDVEQLRTGKYNSLREYPHLAARLKRRVTPEVAAIAAEAVLRRDTLEPSARVRLFGELAAHFRGLVEYPAEIVEDLADERYVRNVLEVVFVR